MNTIKATVVGDIPPHRLLWLYGSENGNEMRIGLPKDRGNYVDFVTSKALEDGQEVNVSITGNPIWIVEAATEITVGSNISANTDGRVGQYTSSPIRIGYALDSGNEGDLVRIVRSPKVYIDKLQEQNPNDLTNGELKKMLDEQGIEYKNNANKKELIELLNGDSDA